MVELCENEFHTWCMQKKKKRVLKEGKGKMNLRGRESVEMIVNVKIHPIGLYL